LTPFLENNHCHEIILMWAMHAKNSIESLLKMIWFLRFHKHQTVTCQKINMSLLTLRTLTNPPIHMNRDLASLGRTTETPNHANTTYHIFELKLQLTKRWFLSSTFVFLHNFLSSSCLLQKTHEWVDYQISGLSCVTDAQ